MTIYTQFELLGRILIAAICGALIGFERKNRKKEAGIRTHIIVAVAASLLMIISKYGFFDLVSGNMFPGADVRLDPSRISSCIVSGIGFLGAGMIFTYKKTVSGLTTAAGIWATAGIGMAIGAGLYVIGISCAVLIVILQLLLHNRLRLFRTEIHEEIVFEVNNYKDAIDSIEENFETLGIAVEGFELEKLGEKRARISFDVSAREDKIREILELSLKNDNIISVNLE